MTLAIALCLPLCVLSAFVADPIARILFPGDPGLCALVIRITIWSLPLSAVDMIVSYSMNAAGRESSQMRIALVANVVTFVASIILIYQFGLVGACLSYVLRQTIGVALRLADFVGTFRGPFSEIPWIRIAACNLLVLMILWQLHPVLWSPIDGVGGRPSAVVWVKILAKLLLEGGVAMLVYGLSTLLLGVFGDAELGVLLRRFRTRAS